MMFLEGMTRNRLLTFAVLFALSTLSGTSTITTIVASPMPISPGMVSSATTFEITDNLKQLIRTLVDNGTNAAMVIGLVDPNGTEFYGYGKTSNATNATIVNENTLFDIGSITKTFTTTILADMVNNGTVNLNDPIEEYLPPTVRVPTYNGNKITLEDLATHTSGLPDNPPKPNITNIISLIMYPNTRQQLYESLSNVTLTYAPGSKYSYSDMGMALLGDILASKADMPYEQLVIDKILDVLGMNSTRITLSDSTLLSRLASGHLKNGTEIPPIIPNPAFPLGLAPAGSFHSSASDLVKYLSANTGLIKTILDNAMQESHKIRLDTNQNGVEGYDDYVGLGWFTTTNFGSQIIWHNGEVLGYNAFAGFNPTTQRGVVILASTMVQGIPVANVGFGPHDKLSTMIWDLLLN
jgi:serine-type D-Ala-D-Ala carboxypeptidase/endopeptidase